MQIKPTRRKVLITLLNYFVFLFVCYQIS